MKTHLTNFLPDTASPADAAVIADLGSTTFAETFGYLFDDATLQHYLQQTFNQGKIRNSLKKPDNRYQVAWLGNKAIGFSKLKFNSSCAYADEQAQVQLQKIYVLKKYLGLSYGQKLLEQCLQAARAAGCKLMWLHVLQENERAVMFYKKNGFEVLGAAYFSIGSNHLSYHCMARQL